MKMNLAELAVSCERKPCLPETDYLKPLIDLRDFLNFLSSASHSLRYKGLFYFPMYHGNKFKTPGSLSSLFLVGASFE